MTDLDQLIQLSEKATPNFDDQGNFLGYFRIDDHRTCGGRAWCRCSSWCYEDTPCDCCTSEMLPNPETVKALAIALKELLSVEEYGCAYCEGDFVEISPAHMIDGEVVEEVTEFHHDDSCPWKRAREMFGVGEVCGAIGHFDAENVTCELPKYHSGHHYCEKSPTLDRWDLYWNR